MSTVTIRIEPWDYASDLFGPVVGGSIKLKIIGKQLF